MVAPRGSISNNVWRYISRSTDQIEGICEHTNDILGVSQEESYQNIDLHNEIVSFCAILRQVNLFSDKQSCDVIKNLYGEILLPDLDGLSEKLLDKMDMVFIIVEEGKEIQKIIYNYFKIVENVQNDINYIIFISNILP